MTRYWIPLGALNCFLATALGAFGAHALKSRLTEYHLSVFQTGAQYHFYHGLALVLFGLWARSLSTVTAPAAPGLLFALGITLFSGSLYLLALTGISKLGMITPLGGLSFMAAWIMFAWAAWSGA